MPEQFSVQTGEIAIKKHLKSNTWNAFSHFIFHKYIRPRLCCLSSGFSYFRWCDSFNASIVLMTLMIWVFISMKATFMHVYQNESIVCVCVRSFVCLIVIFAYENCVKFVFSCIHMFSFPFAYILLFNVVWAIVPVCNVSYFI